MSAPTGPWRYPEKEAAGGSGQQLLLTRRSPEVKRERETPLRGLDFLPVSQGSVTQLHPLVISALPQPPSASACRHQHSARCLRTAFAAWQIEKQNNWGGGGEDGWNEGDEALKNEGLISGYTLRSKPLLAGLDVWISRCTTYFCESVIKLARLSGCWY